MLLFSEIVKNESRLLYKNCLEKASHYFVLCFVLYLLLSNLCRLDLCFSRQTSCFPLERRFIDHLLRDRMLCLKKTYFVPHLATITLHIFNKHNVYQNWLLKFCSVLHVPYSLGENVYMMDVRVRLSMH